MQNEHQRAAVEKPIAGFTARLCIACVALFCAISALSATGAVGLACLASTAFALVVAKGSDGQSCVRAGISYVGVGLAIAVAHVAVSPSLAHPVAVILGLAVLAMPQLGHAPAAAVLLIVPDTDQLTTLLAFAPAVAVLLAVIAGGRWLVSERRQ